MWKASKCKSGLWLHDFQITRYFADGVEEICSRCGRAEFFRIRGPNDYYLKYHRRSALQRWENNFEIEYGKR